MPDKMSDPPQPAPKKKLQEDGVTNPRDGRGPLRKSDDSSTKLPLHSQVPRPDRPH
jgi:hypothetical protein